MTVGGAKVLTSPSNPKAHFNLSLGTCCALRPAASADWKREFESPGLQPFHCALARCGSRTERSEHQAFAGIVTASDGWPRKFATASRSSRRMGYVMLIITPKSRARRIRDAGIFCRDSRDGILALTTS